MGHCVRSGRSGDRLSFDSPAPGCGIEYWRDSMESRHPESSQRLKAFAVIELLVVIQIIAMRAAILFPIFGTVRENGRQTSTMSNMHTIYVNAKTFYEDEGHFPAALFGYAESPTGLVLPNPPE